MIIKSVSLQPNDLTAMEQPHLDNNGDTCALIKIRTDNLDGIEFSNPNQYISVSYTRGVYSIYVPAISRKLDFLHKDFMPVQLDMADFGIRRLRKGKTYLVVLEATKANDLTSSVIFKVDPKWSEVIFDDKNHTATSNGTIEIPALPGRHTYMVVADDYNLQNGSISIGKNEVKTISVRLQPITHEVNVDCNVSNARVFIDNIDYGGIGKLQIPQGKHEIRLQAKGYLDMERVVVVDRNTSTLSYTLTKNSNEKHIHAVPVTIIAPQSSCIFKNNKKLENWDSSTPIMFMPGKYEISDDRGKTYKLVVKDEPLTINL